MAIDQRQPRGNAQRRPGRHRLTQWTLAGTISLLSCGPATNPPPTSTATLSCNESLETVGAKIAARAADATAPPGDIAEARALYETALQLCIEGEDALAIELGEEALTLLDRKQ